MPLINLRYVMQTVVDSRLPCGAEYVPVYTVNSNWFYACDEKGMWESFDPIMSDLLLGSISVDI